MTRVARAFSQTYFHGTRAVLTAGDMLSTGYQSNFVGQALSWVYFTSTLDAAIWGAELAAGTGDLRIYIVEPTGPIEDDPNVTDKRFPGNPTLSYRSKDPLRILGEAVGWRGPSPDQVSAMREGLARMVAEGTYKILD